MRNILLTLLLIFPIVTLASSDIFRAEVLRITNTTKEYRPETQTTTTIQSIDALLIQENTVISFKNDFIPLSEGDRFLIRRITNDTETSYVVHDKIRSTPLVILLILFIIVVAFFGRKQGIRGLVSLILSLVVIFFVLIPLLSLGWSPTFVSIGVASIIIVLGSYITHGFNRTTSAAVLGMLVTIAGTGVLAHWAVAASSLTGLASEEGLFLSRLHNGNIDMFGLLLGAILIGLLGTLYDAAISQAVIVEELYHANPQSTKKHIYQRALRIGREHIGALVDTLAIAYVGAALPLLLFFSGTGVSFFEAVNREFIATEMVRILVGSIGVVLAVPITTFVASQWIVGKKPKEITGHHHHHH